MSRDKRYLYGFDPAYTSFGIVIYDEDLDDIVHAVTIKTAKQSKKRGIYVADDDTRRLLQITDDITQIFGKYPPRRIYSETPSGGARSASAAKGLAFAKALVAIIARLKHINVVWVSAADAKKSATGDENASKAKVREAMRKRFPDTDWADEYPGGIGAAEHQYDAAAVLEAGLNNSTFRLEL